MIDDHDDGLDDVTTIQHVSQLVRAKSEPHAAYLIVIGGGSSVGKMFKISGEMVIGRGNDTDVHLADDGISRRHAKVSIGPDGSVIVSDMGSTNGTFLNGERVATKALQDGDKIQVGTATILKFSYQDALDEAVQKNLYESATRDGLTQLHNKKYFTEALAKEFAHALRHQAPLALLMLDVDHFKKVNDTYGHPAGDYVLQTLGAKLGEALRADDLAARYGGEEFAVILREATLEQAAICAERLRASLAATSFEFGGTKLPVTISIGVACASPGGQIPTAEDLVAAADRNLYQAKRSGRNRVVAGPK
ncbi:MAG: GGDEF domain-containing protein [Myxococcales bacterium]|nr:GGDEF domain-containing protein [Myxococcales bacterium]